MTASKPTLSVITVVYNNARDIERTLLSVINQTYQAIEYIVIDGAGNVTWESGANRSVNSGTGATLTLTDSWK